MNVEKKLFLYLIYALIGLGNLVIELASFAKEYIRLLILGPILITSLFKDKLKRIPTKVAHNLAKAATDQSGSEEIVLFEEPDYRLRDRQKTVIYSRNYSYGKNFLESLFSRKKKLGRPQKKKINIPLGTFFYKVKFFIFGSIFSFIFLFLPLLVFVFASDLPNPYSLTANVLPKTTKIYDRNGKLLYEIYANQNRTVVKLQDIPKTLHQATIAIEDKDFYNHPGFDLRGITRAAIRNIQNDELQGGSTITQQLIKAAYLSPAPTLQRKIKELVLAFWAERVYTKDEILELYFNYVAYGGTAWGVQSASEVYFGKSVKDITLAQAAFLAGMPKAPSVYSPYSANPTLWKKRQKEVLDAMVKEGYIKPEMAKEALGEKLAFKSQQVPIKAPHFVMYVKDLLVRKYGLSDVERGGLRVTTTLDLTLQEKIQSIVREEVENNYYLNITNGAALVTSPKTGEIIAMIGGKDYFDIENEGNVNVTTSLRQPGSTIKIVTYTLALASGKFTEASILDDSPLAIPLSDGRVYSPVNYDGKFHGRLPLRYAFANSLNIPAVRVAQHVGVDNIVTLGKQMGINSWGPSEKYGLSITLGGAEVTLLDLASAFGTIAGRGERIDLDPFLEIKDSEGKILYKNEPKKERVVNEGVAFIISDILSDNNARSLEFGTNSPLNIPGHRVSVKTGTSDNKRDNWTVGFNDSFLVATWVGNNNNSPMSQNLVSGITGAAPMWNRIISFLLESEEENPIIFPDNVIKKSCLGREYYFIKGTENSVNCTITPTTTPKIDLIPTTQILPTFTPTPTPSSELNNILFDFIQKINEKKRRNRD